MNSTAELAEAALRINADTARRSRPDYFGEVWEICKRHIRSLEELIYFSAYFFTEDRALWEFARRRFEQLRTK